MSVSPTRNSNINAHLDAVHGLRNGQAIRVGALLRLVVTSLVELRNELLVKDLRRDGPAAAAAEKREDALVLGEFLSGRGLGEASDQGRNQGHARDAVRVLGSKGGERGRGGG